VNTLHESSTAQRTPASDRPGSTRLRLLPMLDDKLERGLASPFVDVRAIGGADRGRERIHMPKQDRVEALFAPGECELGVAAADDALGEHGKGVVEKRGGETLAPDFGAQNGSQLDSELSRFERAVRVERPREIAVRQL